MPSVDRSRRQPEHPPRDAEWGRVMFNRPCFVSSDFEGQVTREPGIFTNALTHKHEEYLQRES
jgi:hypothetical protein